MTRLLHLSDPHFGAASAPAAEAFLSHARSHSYDFTVLSGDLSMRARRKELEAAYNFVAMIPKPILIIPGNHDIPAINQPLDRFLSPFRRYSRWFGEDLEPTYLAADFHVVSLNSTRAFGLHRDWSEGYLSQKQLLHCVSSFRSEDGAPFRILTLHHPLLAPAGYHRAVVKPLPDLLQAVDTARIDLVLCGHFHRSQLATAGVLDGWKCVVSQAPTVCSTRLQGEPQGFHEIRFDATKVEITLWRFTDGAFLADSTYHFEKGKDGWKDCRNSVTDEIAVVPPVSSG
jgi:predicted MPP superfamily phosphohydrolase